MTEFDSPANLLNIAAGFQKAQTLFTLVELEIPDILSENKLKACEIARLVKIHPLAMKRFLHACVTLGLLQKSAEYFSNTEITQNFLVKNSRFYLGGQMRRYQKRSYPQWESLTPHLQNWSYGDDKKSNPKDEDQGAGAMVEQHNLALLHGFALSKAFDFSRHKRLLDLGGGTGATSIALCQNYTDLQAIVFDLPENIDIARDFIQKENLSNRISTISGDFKKDDLPDEFDAVLLANFMSVADAETNKNLLKTIYRKLPSGGVCLLSGWIIDNSHLSPQLSVLFCLEDICWNSPDVERDEKIYADWLKSAGFSQIKCETYLEPTKLMYGIKQII